MGVTGALLSGVPAFWLFPWSFCSVQTVRIGFYFTIAFPVASLPKDERQFFVLFAATRSSKRLERQPQRKQRCFPPVSQALRWLLMSRRVSTKWAEAAKLPVPYLTKISYDRDGFFHSINCGPCRRPSFHFPNQFLAAKSTQTDITKGESAWLGSVVLQSLNDNLPQLVPVSTVQGNNISAQ